ncbi:hypothetical protein ELQ90_01520 [Labedella phragmitis]|uniref:DUF320 domain-containing protein n=1 Tax=Labedella phragmitis TaxID=2498849 RepID=A0A3S3Z635_9MICO|nr:hypothetical protein [Labedella phragmitis]RWZ52657.1 hypothetical protein ELQ90_01520 [Labedella phragmitis]
MNITVKRCLYGALMVGGLWFAGTTAASAAETSGDDAVASGTQAILDVEVPVTIGGNSVSLTGDSSSEGSTTSAPAEAPASEPATTNGDDGVGSGTQAPVTISVPVTIGGNSVAPVGDADSADSSTEAPAPAPAGEAPTTSGDDGIASGTQAPIDVSAPVTVGGNSVSLLGDSSSSDSATTTGTDSSATDASGATTSGDDGVLGGTQVIPGIDVPVTIGGNSVSLLGDSSSSDSGVSNETGGTTDGTDGPTDGSTTSGDDGIAGGTQVTPDVTPPVTIGGNAVSIIGDSETSDSGTTTEAGTTGTGSDSRSTTSGDDGILGGTQIDLEGDVPVMTGGNAVSVIGDSETSGSDVTGGTTDGTAAPTDGSTTSGDDGIAGGTQVTPDVTLPVTIGGNAVSIIGDSETSDSGTTTGAGTTGTGGNTTSGDDGIAGGTQVTPDVTLPVTIGGNAVSVIGHSETSGSDVTGGATDGDAGSGDTTSGDDGVLGGSQISPDIGLPLTIGGNAVSVIGDSEATDPTVVVPTDPTTPVDPTDPVEPTDPTTPVDPTDPADGTDGTDAAVSNDGAVSTDGAVSLAAGGPSARAADDGAEGLAATGSSGTALLLGLMSLLIAAGVGLLARSRHSLDIE